MLSTRVIPCLLLLDGSLVKTIKFKDPRYIGDPINAIRIYNEKEVDELIFLDISATVELRSPPLDVLADIVSECFMPVTYGGGIKDVDTIQKILQLGVEKVSINTGALENPNLIETASNKFGSSTIVVSIDVFRNELGKYKVFDHRNHEVTRLDPIDYAIRMENSGAGEILLTSVDRDGTMEGYDVEQIKQITEAVGIPVIACGGAGKLDDFRKAVKIGGASACAAGSMVVYYGRNQAVLINFPDRTKIESVLS